MSPPVHQQQQQQHPQQQQQQQQQQHTQQQAWMSYLRAGPGARLQTPSSAVAYGSYTQPVGGVCVCACGSKPLTERQTKSNTLP